MADITLRLRIEGNASGTVKAATEAERAIGGVARAANTAGRSASTSFELGGRATGNFSAEIDRLRSSAVRVASALGLAGGAFAFTRDIVDASNALEGFRQGLAAATGTQQASAEALGFVRAESARLGVDLRSSAEAFTGLAAAAKGTALEGQGARDIFSAVSETARVMNLSSDRTRGALLALQQMMSKGNVQAEELRGQLGERIPGAFQIAARAMRVGTGELGKMLEAGEVAATDLLPKLATELRRTFGEQAVAAANTPAAEMQRLRNAVFELEAAIGDAGFMRALASGARSVAEQLSVLTRSGALDDLLSGLKSLGAVVGTVFAGRALGQIVQWIERQAEAIATARLNVVATRAVAAAALEEAQARSVSLAGTLQAITAARAQVIAKQQSAVAEIAASEAALAAASATTQGSFALQTQREATDQLTAAKARLGAVTTDLAALGRAQAGVQTQLTVAAGAQVAAQEALNASMARGGVVMSGLRTAGSRLFALIGGWPTVALAAGFALYKLWDATREGERAARAPITALEGLNAKLREQVRLRGLIQSGSATEANVREIDVLQKAVDKARELETRIAPLRAQLDGLLRAGGGGGDQGTVRQINALQAEIAPLQRNLEDAKKNLSDFFSSKLALGDFSAIPKSFRDMATSARDAAQQFSRLIGLSREAANVEPPKFSDDLAKSLNERLQALQAERIELTQGKRARLEFETFNETGAQSVEQLDDRLRKLIDSVAAESAAVDAAKEAQKRANEEREKAVRIADQAKEAGEAFRIETAKLQAELAGPSAQAFAEFSGEIEKARVLLLAGGISVDDFVARARVARETLDRTDTAIAAQRAPIQQMLDDLRSEAELIGLTSTEREVAIALRQAEAALIEQGIDLASQQAQTQLAQVEALVRGNVSQRETAEIAQQAAEDYQRAWQGATDSVLRSFGEFVARGANNFKSLGRQIKDIARGFLADLVAMFLRNTLVLRVGTASGGLLGGLLGSGGAAAGVSAGAGNILGLLSGTQTPASQFNGSGPLLTFQNPAPTAGGFSLGTIFGENTSGTFLGGAGAAAQSAAIGSLIGGLFGGRGSTGGAIGGAIGSAVAGPVGAAVGSVLGGLVGGLFGKFKTVGSGAEFTVGASGAAGFQFENQKKKTLFSSKRRTITTALDSEAQAAIDDLFAGVSASVEAAAAALAVDVPPLIAGSFRREFDKAGNLEREFSTIAGNVVNETQEAFAQRLQALNILAVVDAALGPLDQDLGQAITQPVIDGLEDFEREFGGAFAGIITRGLAPALPAIAQAQGEASRIAQRWAGDAQKLLSGAQFLLAASVDLKNGFGLLGTDGTLTDITALVEDLAKANEPLLDTYARLVTGTELLTQALALQDQSLDLGREQFVRFAAGIVDAAGGLDRAQALWTDYFNRFFSDNERAAQSLSAAQQAAQAQFGDIGLNASDFASAAGLQQFRALFEQALPTLAADAVVQWLEAAQALGVVIDAQDALNQTLGQAEQVAGEATQALADLMADIRGQASEATIALAEFDLSPLAQSINAVARQTQAAIDEATRLGATEADLSEIRALGSSRAELLQRQAQRELADLLSGVSAELAEFDLSPLEIELSRIDRAMRETLDQATALGATETQLATIRELASRQSAQAVEAEAERLRAAFARLAESIGRVRGSIAEDILSLRRAAPGFDEAAFQRGRLDNLRAALDAATDPTERVDLIDQIRQATLGRYNAELAAIEQAQQAQQVAAQEAQRGIEAQREALNRLRGFVDTLGLSSASPLTAFQRLDEARLVFDQTLSRARGGDADAIGGLQEAANALLTENRAVFGVSNTAVQEFERVRSALSGIAGQGVRGAAAISDPFQRASLDTSARIAALQASTIAELQGLDDALAMLEVTQQADTEGTLQALRDRFDQAETHKTEIVEHIQPIVDVLTRADDTGQSQLVELRAQTVALQGVIAGIEDQTSVSSAFLDKIAVNLDAQEQRINALIERLGRAIERTSGAGVRL